MKAAIEKVLFITVGGSHQPIVTAIEESSPDFVVFFCSGTNQATGRKGSESHITGVGKCIKEGFGPDVRPTLPNIPTQVGLTPEQFQLVIVTEDQLDSCYKLMMTSIREIKASHPDANLLADYTGGTKTMTAALAIAAVNIPEMGLRVITGIRSDLVRVSDGTQYQASVNLTEFRFELLFQRALASWSHYGWYEAVHSLDQIERGALPQNVQQRWDRAKALSQLFASWNHFNYDEAKIILDQFNNVIANKAPHLILFINALTNPTSQPHTTSRLWDLWLNALRCGESGRFDDGVARLYRLLEWTAQWQLKLHLDIETSDVSREIAERYKLKANHKEKYQIGLFQAWLILTSERPDSLFAHFYQEEGKALLGHVEKRNASLLAHGTTPVSKADWKEFLGWMEKKFIPVLSKEITARPFRQTLFKQLPNHYIWDF